MVIMRRLYRLNGRLLTGMLMLSLACHVSAVQDAATGLSLVPLQIVNIDITTHLGDHQVFLEQDVISFYISLDHSAYLYAFYQDASGSIFQLVPGKAQPQHYFTAGYYLPFPAQNSPFKFVVAAPYGEEQLWVFASDQGKLEFNGKTGDQGLKQIRQNYAELADVIKASSVKLYGKSRLLIQTRGR